MQVRMKESVLGISFNTYKVRKRKNDDIADGRRHHLKLLPLLILLFFSTISVSLNSQNIDSLHFMQANWTSTKIKKNIYLHTHNFTNKELFSSNQNISYIEVKKAAAHRIHIGYEKQKLLPTSVIADNFGAVAAINGSFFDMQKGGSVNYLRINNVVLDTNRMSTINKRTSRALAVVGTDKRGNFRVAKLQSAHNWEKGFSWSDMLASGPMLSYEGMPESFDQEKFNSSRHPRTAVGIKKNGNVILLTVDGRNAHAQGASMWELQKIMLWLGCVTAANLDGGGSTTLWVKGFAEGGIVNYPSDTKNWDHSGQRKVANIIFVK